MKKSFKVKVNDTFNYDLIDSDLEQLDLLKISNSKFHLIENNKNYEISIEKSDFNSKNYSVKINNNAYNIHILNQLDQLIKHMGFSKSSIKKANNIKAPMPGLILSIDVKLNQAVVEGQVLLILEAMKMENSICAIKNGTIKSIHVKKGGAVEKGELLIEMA